MKAIFYILLSALFFNACVSEKEKETTKHSPKIAFPDTIWLDIDSTSRIRLGKEELDLDVIGKRLSDSIQVLKKQGMQKVPVLDFHSWGTVMMGVRGELRDILQETQAKEQK